MLKTKNKITHARVIKKGNIFLKIIGLQLDEGDVNRNFLGRLRPRRIGTLSYIVIIISIFAQSGWLLDNGLRNKSNLIDITYLLPCLIMCLLGFMKSYYFLKHTELIHSIIGTLTKLHCNNTARKHEGREFETKSVRLLMIATTIMTWSSILSISAFGVGPLVIMARIYYKSGELKLRYPFLFYYPFDVHDIRIWPLIYAHQMWSAVVAVFSFLGPDYISYALITLVVIQFFYLKDTIRNLIINKTNRLYRRNKSFRILFVRIVTCHTELTRCVEMIEAMYSKTILFNILSSSLLICMTGFNIMAFGHTVSVLIPSFVTSLSLVLGQIFLLCFYGDMLMRSSLEVQDAVYDSLWYVADPGIVKDLIFISMRANNPCKLTAYGFSDVNLNLFTNILGKSFSYFTLLKTIYGQYNQ